MEQRQLAWLITTRSQVRVLVPQPRKSDHFGGRFFLAQNRLVLYYLQMQDEQWQVYDSQGRVIPNKGVSPEDGYAQAVLHGAAHVWAWRAGTRGPEVLLQKRSSQKWTWPNCFDISAAGHIDLGEEPLAAAVRETHEEIGVQSPETDLELVMVHRRKMFAGNSRTENEFCWVYLLKLDASTDFTMQDDEVSGLEWKPLADFRTEVLGSDNDAYVPHGSGYYTAIIEAVNRAANDQD